MRLVGVGVEVLRIFGYALVVVSAVGVFVALLNAMRDRRYDLAVIRVLGASPGNTGIYYARALNQMSPFGAFLDPVADKLMVAGALIMLLQLERVESVVALIIIGREIAISALREWMAQIGRAKSVAVAFVGKIKTAVQMVAIPLLLYEDDLFGQINCRWLGTILINVAAVLTVISMLYYLRKALPLATWKFEI